MSTLTIQPYRLNLDGSVSATGSAASAIDPTATETLNEPGQGSVKFRNSDAVLDSLGMDGRDILQVRIDGTPVFAFMPDPAKITTIAQGEEKDELTELSGPGLLGGILSRRLIYPTGGMLDMGGGVFRSRQPRERDRFANWTHPDFDDSGPEWIDSQEVAMVGDAKAGGATPWPDPWADDFPYDQAQILWPDNPLGSASTYLDADPGHCWFRYGGFQASASDDALVRIFWATDNRGELYIDGQQVGTSDSYTATTQTDVQMSSGFHVLACHVDNSSVFPANPSGPGGFAYAAYQVTLAGLVLFSYSFSGVQVLPYQDDPPGVTPGQAWIWLDDEAEARGCEPIVRSFNAATDSNSASWTPESDIATQVKATMLDWQGQLSGTYADFRFDPDLSSGLSLGMYRLGEMGTSSGVTLTRGVNITSLEHQRENMPITATLIDGADDWYERVDSSAVSAYGRVEAGLDIGAPASVAEILRIADGQLDYFNHPREEIDAGVRGPIPGVDYVVGDTVNVPDSNGVTAARRCVAITWTTMPGVDTAVFTSAFDTIVASADERIIRMASAR